jgi:hypothetical protein
VTVTEFVVGFHVPTVLTLCGLFIFQHHHTLSFFMISVVQAPGAGKISFGDLVQGRVIA